MSKNAQFTQVKVNIPRGNVFDLTHDVKMSTQAGKLTPIMAMECLPGDRVKVGFDLFVRMAPMIAPLMHRMDVTCHAFFVPNRLTWPNWEKYIANEPTGGLPFYQISAANVGGNTARQKFLDYMGIPPWDDGDQAEDVNINALPLAAYQLIYNEWYRDENLVTEVTAELTDGDNSSNSDLVTQRFRAWEHDYFTASLPFAQKGDEVLIPLGNVVIDPNWNPAGGDPVPHFQSQLGNANNGSIENLGGAIISNPGGLGLPYAYDPNGTLISESAAINDLRRAFRVQEWLEKNARGGTRYIELIKAHFGVKSSDARLNRPEYIVGTKTPIAISEVLNTSGATDAAAPVQGNMAGHGVSVGTGKKKGYFVEEHGYIIGIMSITPKAAYQQGISKNYLRTDPLDFYWPSFAHIGEQPVMNNELYAYSGTGTQTFGYVPRYAEYRYMPSRVAGDFRTSLNFWHLGRIFPNLPTLSQEFIEVVNEDVERAFAVQDPDIDNFYCHVLNKVKAYRLIPEFGTPTI